METAVLEERNGAEPLAFALAQNFPNPFNSQTAIRFSLSRRTVVKLAVYNLVGQQVVALAEGVREAGTYTLDWDGRDAAGHALASGAYFYRLEAGTPVEERKLMLLR